MEKKDFTKRYAQHTHSTSAEAADQIDRVVDGLLRRLRAGHPASLPGFGTLLPPVHSPSQPPSDSAGRRAKTKPRIKPQIKPAAKGVSR